MKFFARKVERASWRRVAAALVLLFAYSCWGFLLDPSWNAALAAAGGRLPETQPGFPAGEPARSFALLAEANLIAAYVRFQAIDIPFAVLNAFFMASAIALGVKKLVGPAAPARFALALPFAYLFAEFAEDALLVLLATEKAPAALVPLQQAATTLKWAAMAPAFLLALALLIPAIWVGLSRRKV